MSIPTFPVFYKELLRSNSHSDSFDPTRVIANDFGSFYKEYKRTHGGSDSFDPKNVSDYKTFYKEFIRSVSYSTTYNL